MSELCEECGAPLSIGQGSAEVEIDSLKMEIEQLEDRLRAARGGCKMLSQGDECDCGLCKRDRKLAECHRLLRWLLDKLDNMSDGWWPELHEMNEWVKQAEKAGGEHE